MHCSPPCVALGHGPACPPTCPSKPRCQPGHRASQTTVEQKNGEVRKNVLKYDEVRTSSASHLHSAAIRSCRRRPARRSRRVSRRAVTPPSHVLCGGVLRGVWTSMVSGGIGTFFWPSHSTPTNCGNRLYGRLVRLLMARPRPLRSVRLSSALRSCVISNARSCCASSISAGGASLRDGLPQEGITWGHGPEGPARGVQREGFDMFGQ